MVQSAKQLARHINVEAVEYSTDMRTCNVILREIKHNTLCNKVGSFEFGCDPVLPMEWTGATAKCFAKRRWVSNSQSYDPVPNILPTDPLTLA